MSKGVKFSLGIAFMGTPFGFVVGLEDGVKAGLIFILMVGTVFFGIAMAWYSLLEDR
jgi:hypothetical protein